MSEKHSTSALAKMRGQDPKQLFADLTRAGYITRSQDKWVLTELGARFGGEYVDHPKFGQFIVWPAHLHIELAATEGVTLSATQLGVKLALSAKRMNQLLSELGWIQRSDDGWLATEAGIRAGAQPRAEKASGHPFVVWHDSVLRNKRLKQSVVEFLGQDAESHATDKSYSSFQQKFLAKHRTLDGHYVRSKGELLIDNWLYLAGVVHAYERQLPIEQDVMSDFYLPGGKVYVQFWGSDQGEVAPAQRDAIRAVYEQHNFPLIEIEVRELDKLDEVLPARLRRYGIRAY
ncbi:glycerol kinase [Vibrio sp. CAU 1672]|uniref:glycerol kinase n=1 Tax=Vibrio sp. CAU 1672 TaxID=3032594 RepID=UPI0023DA72FB|nr:glycerol kinase [Vibrio sp. CAU 1672]MDF2155222.1 glycerol kinase [Vibrio sp. CAU 1672]